MYDIIKTGLKLLLITTVAALSLGVVYSATEEPIEDQRIRAADAARRTVLNQAVDFQKIDSPIDQDVYPGLIEAYTGISEDGSITGYTFKVITLGYGGDIEVFIGIYKDQSLGSVFVARHLETPGLGSKAALPEFVNQFDSKDTEHPMVVVKESPSSDYDIQAVTGATITSNAITSGVNTAIDYYINVLKSGGES